MSLIDEYEFKKCVDRYKGDRYAIKFNCRDQFIVMSFTQFTDRFGLRDIETTLNLCGDLYRSGIKVMPKSTLAEANEKKDWRIYQDFAMTLVKEATALYKDEKLRIGPGEMIYAFDSSTIELCLKPCLWAEFHHRKDAFFVSSATDNMVYKVVASVPVDKNSGVLSDETIHLTGYYSVKKYPDTLGLVVYEDFETGKAYHFLTNNFSIEDPLTIAELYRERWQIELFFKWIKQHLRLPAAHHCAEAIWSCSKSSFYLQLNRTGALQKSRHP